MSISYDKAKHGYTLLTASFLLGGSMPGVVQPQTRYLDTRAMRGDNCRRRFV